MILHGVCCSLQILFRTCRFWGWWRETTLEEALRTLSSLRTLRKLKEAANVVHFVKFGDCYQYGKLGMRRIRDEDVGGDAAGRELWRSLAKPGTGDAQVALYGADGSESFVLICCEVKWV